MADIPVGDVVAAVDSLLPATTDRQTAAVRSLDLRHASFRYEVSSSSPRPATTAAALD